MLWAAHRVASFAARASASALPRFSVAVAASPLSFGALCFSVLAVAPAAAGDSDDSLWLLNRNHRTPGKANRRARPNSHVGRKSKASRKGKPTICGRGRHPKGQ